MIDPQCGTCHHFWFRKGDCTGAAETCEDYNRDMSTKPSITTRFGIFQVTRKGTVAISVVKTKHRVTHHRIPFMAGETTHVEHRKIPKKTKNPESMNTGWYTWIATFGLDGKELIRR